MLLRMYTLERGDPHPDPGEATLILTLILTLAGRPGLNGPERHL